MQLKALAPGAAASSGAAVAAARHNRRSIELSDLGTGHPGPGRWESAWPFAGRASAPYLTGMCGRFALFSTGDQLQRQFGLDAAPEVSPSYNIAPGAGVPVIAWSREQQPRLLAPVMLWGFPMNAEETLINARGETAASKPTFAPAWKSRRCAIPFDAFYEWNKRKQPKEPWCFRALNGPLAFAGLYWPLAQPSGGRRYGFAILTTEPNRDVADVHHRMPVLLQPDEVATCANPGASTTELRDLCRTPPAGLLQAQQAPLDINKTDVDGPWLLGSHRHQHAG